MSTIDEFSDLVKRLRAIHVGMVAEDIILDVDVDGNRTTPEGEAAAAIEDLADRVDRTAKTANEEIFRHRVEAGLSVPEDHPQVIEARRRIESARQPVDGQPGPGPGARAAAARGEGAL